VGKRPLVRPRHRWEDNIETDLEEIVCEAVGLVSSYSGEDLVTGCCEHDNEPFGSIEGVEFLD
jgi:hypothetical protein